MEEFTFGSLIESAKEAGGTGDAPPNGTYPGSVVSANSGLSKGGKLKIGLKLRVEGGAHDGAGIWTNQYLSPESPAAVDIFFRTFEALGIPRNWWAQFGANTDAAGAAVVDFVKGATCQFTVGTGKDQNGNPQPEVKRISKATGAPAAPGAVTPPQPAAVAAPAAPSPAAAATPPVPTAPTVQAPKPPF